MSKLETGSHDVVIRASAAFRTIATCPSGDAGHVARARSLELYMASDDRPIESQLWTLVGVGAHMTADEISAAGGQFPEAVSDAVDAPNPVDPRAGAFAAVLAELDHDAAASVVALNAVYDAHGTDGLVIAVGYLCRLFQEARQTRRERVQERPGRVDGTRPGGEDA